MKVRLTQRHTTDGVELWSLTVGREYEVLGIEADHYRLLDDTKEPYLFPESCFVVVDPNEPPFWVSSSGEDGERYSYPSEWDAPGFFEDYFDQDPRARAVFEKTLAQRWPEIGGRPAG